MQDWLLKKTNPSPRLQTQGLDENNIAIMRKRVLLLDDEPNSIKLLQFLIAQECPEMDVIGAFTDAPTGLNAILTDKPDLVIMDIEMPHLNGFEVLDRCPQPLPFHLIFVTAYDQYAVRAFKYSAMDYLLKPISADDLLIAVQKVMTSAKPNQQQVNVLQQFNPAKKGDASPTRLTISTMEGMTFIEIKDIIHCDSDGAYTKIYVTGEKGAMIVSKSIKEIEEMLSFPNFFRAHHSHLLNLNHVKKFIRTEGGDALMSNGAVIPVSRSKKQEFLDAVSVI
jgi:two-component system, LytTR family, response regulator